MAYDAAQLEHNLTSHPPTSDRTIGRFEHLRAKAKAFGMAILADVPEGREKALALTSLEQTLQWAVAGVARGQEPVRRAPEWDGTLEDGPNVAFESFLHSRGPLQ